MSVTNHGLQEGIIAVLPPELANQIAAGEVVERPASVVKELVENALDAQATQVFVTVEGGGRRKISVVDNGFGMSRGEARLCLERHATSKVRTFEDLGNISSLGFRGEALPSIASVSRFSLTTRREEDLEGTTVRVLGTESIEVAPAPCPVGTEVTVEALFFNTPARFKFLKTEATERRHITEVMMRLALARRSIHIRLVAEGRTVMDAGPYVDMADRASAVLGTAVSEHLYPVLGEARRGNVTVTGMFSAPHAFRRNTSGLFTFVNGRFVRDQRIIAAVRTGYSGLLEKGQYPTVVLRIMVPPAEVDVNVHPAKIEVRFHQPDLVFRAVRAALIDGLAEAPWVPQGKGKRLYTLHGAGDGEVPKLRLSGGRLPAENEPVQETLAITRRADPESSLGGWWTSREPPRLDPASVTRHDYFASLSVIGVLRSTYILCQDDEGLVVIDQHAAHERITFERLKEVYAGHHREIQALLLPVQLELDALQSQTLEEQVPFFEALGFELDAFSEGTFVLRSVPAVLLGASYQRLIRETLDELAQSGHSQRVDEAMDAVLSRMACHGSVRAGDQMAPEESRALLSQMDQIDFRGNCPHGRPVYFRMSWEDIERRFERR